MVAIFSFDFHHDSKILIGPRAQRELHSYSSPMIAKASGIGRVRPRSVDRLRSSTTRERWPRCHGPHSSTIYTQYKPGKALPRNRCLGSMHWLYGGLLFFRWGLEPLDDRTGANLNDE